MDADSNDEINVRSDSYWIAHTTGECGHCGAATRLIALALPPGHESLTLEWSVDGDESIGHVWEGIGASALLFYVEHLPEDLQRRLEEFSGNYHLAGSDYTRGPYWANHCGSCGAAIDDHDLFCEPGGAFPAHHSRECSRGHAGADRAGTPSSRNRLCLRASVLRIDGCQLKRRGDVFSQR